MATINNVEKQPGATKVTVTVEIETAYDLDVDYVFPDGCPNPSGHWTAETLAIYLRTIYSSKRRLLEDWEMLRDDFVSIHLTDDRGNTADVKLS